MDFILARKGTLQMTSEREKLVFKFETDNTTPTSVFCLSIIDTATGDLSRYADNHPHLEPIWPGILRITAAETAISHTVFHRKVVETYFAMPIVDYTDTFAILREIFPDKSAKLTDWAARLGMPLTQGRCNKAWTAALQQRCDQGCRVIFRLWQELNGKLTG
jgi:hypothetical protein